MKSVSENRQRSDSLWGNRLPWPQPHEIYLSLSVLSHLYYCNTWYTPVTLSVCSFCWTNVCLFAPLYWPDTLVAAMKRNVFQKRQSGGEGRHGCKEQAQRLPQPQSQNLVYCFSIFSLKLRLGLRLGLKSHFKNRLFLNRWFYQVKCYCSLRTHFADVIAGAAKCLCY